MTHFEPSAAKYWLDGLPGGSVGNGWMAQWRAFASTPRPVVTVFGAYDTGKSSLVRRLLRESGQEVPEWLTISARHETFEVSSTELAGCTVRDTPGFVPYGDDVRADVNSRHAMDAIGLTDIGIITMTPQLATAEYETLISLISRGWAADALWFVITRFDEAGIDPQSDLEGYRELGERKTRELRNALGLSGEAPVFVVSQDFAQGAGSDRNPDPSIWDESREWDGIDRLLQQLSRTGGSDLTPLRAAAEQRFWRHAVESTLAELRVQRADYVGISELASDGARMRESWEGQLDAISSSAEVDLRARVQETVRGLVRSDNEAQDIGEKLTATLDLWYTTHEREVDRLLQNISSANNIQRERPGWQNLDMLTAKLRPDAGHSEAAQDGLRVTPLIQMVGDSVLDALIRYDKAASPKAVGAPKVVAHSVKSISQKVAVATAVLPAVYQIAALAEEQYHEKAAREDRERDRRERQSAIQHVADEVADLALTAWQPLIDSARDAIHQVTEEQVALRDSLAALVAGLQVAIDDGELLAETD